MLAGINANSLDDFTIDKWLDNNGDCDDYDNFIVEADSEQNLAAAIVAARMDCGEDSKELDSSVWRVRELGEEFDYNVNLEYVCKGKRL